jgi:class 3 adenylate cyclase/tetratricopeptide (TPR) repeat protein
MELLAERDPEVARKLLDPVLEIMMEAVHHYEGTVNQVMGDGIMALFGAPLALEDHAVRACFAALRMQDRVSRYGDEMQRKQGTPIQVRVGLNSGEVVVRAIGSDLNMDYTAVGQTTHLAARMEQMAKPGTALITSDTLRLAEGYVQVRALGPVPVKGLVDAIEVFELTGASAARTRLQAAATRGLTRFVGRTRELELLVEALASAQRGKGQVVAIVGEPGVGKSRLFYEFTRSHRTEGWLLVEAGSVSYGKATPYLPVIDLLKSYFRIGDQDDARTIRERVTGKLLTLDRALEPLLSPLLALLDQPVEDAQWQRLDPPQRRRQTLDALKRLWLREAQAQPLILVFEDLHWIDSETQEFLDGLLESVPAAHLLLLFNYRPEYHHAWGGKTYYNQLRLDPLSGQSAEDFLSSLLGSDPRLQPLQKLLVERTEGNPFFLEESVRTLVESGALSGERGHYRLLHSLDRLEVPETVQAVLAARIDRLEADDKRLLQTAAVIGKDVPYALLQAIAGLPETRLRDGLTRLQAAEFLYEAALFPDLEYTFKHALTHDVAYASLLQARRRTLHTRIVEAIEALYADRWEEHVERLAHHALQAELSDKALSYLTHAAKKASTRRAYREAARYLELALQVVERRSDRNDVATQELDVRLKLREALAPAASFARISEVLQEAIRLAERIGDQKSLAWALTWESFSAIERCDVPEALQSGRRALALAEQIGNPTLILSGRHYLGQIPYTLGDYQQAIEILRPVLEASDETVIDALSQGAYAVTSYFLPLSLAECGMFADALSASEVMMRRAEAGGHPFTIEMMCVGVGYTHLRRGVTAHAISQLERGITLCRTYALDIMVPWTASCLGMAYALAGRYGDGVDHAVEAVKRSESLGITRFQPLRVSMLANTYLLAGRREEAHAAALQALELASRYQEKGPEAWALYLLAASRDLAANDAEEAARREYLSALSRSEELGMRPLTAHCHLGVGQLHLTCRDATRAREHLGKALALYREMGMQHWLTQAESVLNSF